VARKTNKTSHVLNLITNGNDADPDPDKVLEAEAEDIKPAADTLAENSPAAEDTSAEDTNKATEEHAAALRENAEALRMSAAAMRETTQQDEGKAETKVEEEISPDADIIAPAPVTAPEEPAAKPAPAGDKKVIVVNKSSENDKLSTEIMNNLASHLEEEEKKQILFRRVNVMEEILSHMDLEKHMNRYDVCKCQRCHVDVLALTLTRLPAKYVVVGENMVAPILGYYENKYKIRILTEINKACMIVGEHPRHDSGN